MYCELRTYSSSCNERHSNATLVGKFLTDKEQLVANRPAALELYTALAARWLVLRSSGGPTHLQERESSVLQGLAAVESDGSQSPAWL